MNTDIRVNIGLLHHIKTKKLIRKLGYEGFYSLIALWIYTGVNHPKGNLNGMNNFDIESVAEWTGEEGKFTETLLELRLIELIDNSYCLHDWEEHQNWACGAKERSEQARNAANVRWNREKQADGNAIGMPLVCSEHADSNADSNAPLLSSPPPSSPKENTNTRKRVRKPKIRRDPQECLKLKDYDDILLVDEELNRLRAQYKTKDLKDVMFDIQNWINEVPSELNSRKFDRNHYFTIINWLKRRGIDPDKAKLKEYEQSKTAKPTGSDTAQPSC